MSVAKVRAAMSIFIVRYVSMLRTLVGRIVHQRGPIGRRLQLCVAFGMRTFRATTRQISRTCSSLRRSVCDQFIDALCRSLRFAVLSHTGPIGIIPVGVVEVAAVLKGGRACRADGGAGSLGVAWRCQRGHGEPQGKHSQTCPQDSHDESPSIYLWWDHATLLMNLDALVIRLQAPGFVRSAPASRKRLPHTAWARS